MKVIVTCGPAHEPIDGTRRLTNFSTGHLGTTLAEALHGRGHEVLCLRGSGATFREHPAGVRIVEFGTNAELEGTLLELSRTMQIDAVFHAAALCDFGVAEVHDEQGRVPPLGKLPSRVEGYRLLLKPLPKVIHRLRMLFPGAFLAGWKYETEGGAGRVVTLGRRQIEESKTDLCVLNGPGYGPGFGLLTPDGTVTHAAGLEELRRELIGRLTR